MTSRARWSTRSRRLGIMAGVGILAVGVLYIATIGAWLVAKASPRDPIPDPYLAVMEVLTMCSALLLFGFVVSVWCFADEQHRVSALAALVSGSAAAVLTSAVHFVQLTAIRQLWRLGRLEDYRLIWPSPLFAVEYFAWDVLVGLTMVFSAIAIAGTPQAATARRALLAGGILCVLGVTGPLSGLMLLQNAGLLGYGVVLPVAAALVAQVFRATPSSGSEEAAPGS
ncbi:MAG: hypothetical protein U0163_16905 [Gemmatimonadaceae bacterium]